MESARYAFLVDTEVSRSRAWVMTQRIAHTAHHRGQQSASSPA